VNEKRLNELMEAAIDLPPEMRGVHPVPRRWKDLAQQIQDGPTPHDWARLVAERFRDAILDDWGK
jgi:hypothetical protein